MMKQKRWVLLWLVLVMPAFLLAQKKEISQARQWIKNGNNLENAENSMRKLLADSVNRHNEKIWETLFNALKKQYSQGNEQLYLKQQYDTARLFVSAKKMFEVLEAFDSIESIPNKKGEVNMKWREKHADFLHPLRHNLFSGGAFFIKRKDFQSAYNMFDTYIDCANQPLFSKYKYAESDARLPEAAYWAVFCAYRMNKPKEVLHHTYLALKDKAHYVYMLQYLADTYMKENDLERYLATLREGFDKFPTFDYFFPRLVDYYSQARQYDKAEEVVDKAMAVDSTNVVYRFAKSTVLLNTGRYDECIRVSDALISQNDSMPEAYLNAGLAFYNKAVEIKKKTTASRNDHKLMLANYHKAMPYLERFRQLAPEQKDKWGLPLYTIYLNLNKGKEFDEISQELTKQEK